MGPATPHTKSIEKKWEKQEGYQNKKPQRRRTATLWPRYTDLKIKWRHIHILCFSSWLVHIIPKQTQNLWMPAAPA